MREARSGCKGGGTALRRNGAREMSGGECAIEEFFYCAEEAGGAFRTACAGRGLFEISEALPPQFQDCLRRARTKRESRRVKPSEKAKESHTPVRPHALESINAKAVMATRPRERAITELSRPRPTAE